MTVTLHPPTVPTAILGFVAVGLLPASAQITTHVWSGGSVPLGNRNWTSAGNWVGGIPPKSFANTEVFFTGNMPLDAHPIVNEPWSLRFLSLNMTSVIGSARLEGEPLTIGTGGITTDDWVSIDNPIKIRRDQPWSVTGGYESVLDIHNTVEFLEPGIVSPYTITITGRVRLYSDIIGTGTITSTNGGSVAFSPLGESRYAVNTTFRIEDDSFVSLNNATIDAGAIRPIGTGTMALTSPGSLLNANSLQGTGNIRFHDQSNSAISTLNHKGSTHEAFSGTFIGGTLSNRRGKFIKSGTANLTLNRATSSGSLYHLDLAAGSLILNNNTMLSCNTLSGSAILDTRPGSTFRLLEGGPSVFQGTITGGGNLTVSEGHSLTLQSSGVHEVDVTSLAGDLTVSGSAYYTRRITSTGNAIIGANSELRLTDTTDHAFSGEIRNTGTAAAPNGLVLVANPTTFTLNGTAKQHSFASLALASGATLQLGNQSELLVRSYSGSGGTLRLTGDSTAFLVENPSAAFPMRIDAAGGNVVIPVGARFQLAAASKTHNVGHLDIGNRGLDLGGSSSLTLGRLSGSVALSINSGSSLTLADFHDSPFTGAFINGAAGGGSLSLTSAGTKVLRAGGFTGTTTLGGTSAAIYQSLPGTAPNGPLTVSANAKLEAANLNNTSTNLAGVFEIRSVPSPDGPVHGGCATGTFTQTDGSRTILTINDRPTRPLGFGKIVASGDISLANAAILEVNINNNFGAQPGDSWTLFSTTGGKFTQVNLPANRTIHATNLPPNTQLIWVKTPTALSLQLVSTDTDPPGYYTWATANNLTPANRGPFLDPDNDLIPNWREYLLGLNPLASAHPSTPGHESLIQAGQPIVRFRLSPAADFTNDFEVQGSSDLGITDPWNSSKATLLGSGTLPDSFLYRDYRFHLLSSSAPRGFLRIRYKGLTAHPND